VLEKYSTGSWEITRVSSKAKIEEAREMLKSGNDIAAALRLLILAVQYTAGNGSDFSGRHSNEALAPPKENMDACKGSWRLCNQQSVDFVRTCSSRLL
jgi:hypothetical protein